MRALRALSTVALVVSLVALGGLPAVGADRDHDGLRDGFEQRWGVTDPDRSDSDRDGVVDSAEDYDKDGLSNLGEQRFGTNPKRRDTDRDGVPDAREDADRDGRSNGREQDQRPLPTKLKPSLSAAVRSFPPIRWKCQTEDRRSRPVTCSFGPKDSATTIVLVGDSHAMMWSSPIRNIAASKGWRLTVMTKTACPPYLGINTGSQLRVDGGKTCRTWRRNVMAKLKADPPDLVIITSSERYRLYSPKGRAEAKSRWPLLWQQALARTLKWLPERSQALVLGDVPPNYGNPRTCLARNPRDISACVTPKPPAWSRRVELGLRRAARAGGADFRTLFGKICSYDPCPLVQGQILMWRDKSHLTNTFAVKLQPSMRAILERALSGSG